jgi:hypothetical protein
VGIDFPFGYFPLEYGSGVAQATVPGIGFGSSDDNPDNELHGPRGRWHIRDGAFYLITGPLIDIVPTAFDFSYYNYGPGGFLKIDFDIELHNGKIHPGTFSAPLVGPFIIGATDDGEPISPGSIKGAIGPGLFDPWTARLLGIRRWTLPMELDEFYMDANDMTAPERIGKLYGYLHPTAQAPEPSIVLLAGAGVAAWLRRRRQSRT